MIHKTCEINSPVPPSTIAWNGTTISRDVVLGERVKLGRDVFIGPHTLIGNDCKIQNGCQIFGAEIGDNVLIGPLVIIVEDPWPRAFEVCEHVDKVANSAFVRKKVNVGNNSSIGAGAIIAPGVNVGEFALVSAGAVVLGDVPAYSLCVGNPARVIGTVCKCGRRSHECTGHLSTAEML